MMECKKLDNLKKCPCTYQGCPRKGICCECIQHHVKNNELPACCFSEQAERKYDRSFEAFIKDRGNMK